MNDYKLKTFKNDLKELILASKELNEIKKSMKAEKNAYGENAFSDVLRSRLTCTLAIIGERATGLSQIGMNEDDPDLLNIVNELHELSK